MTVSGDLIRSAEKGDTFLNRITKGDETWCSIYDSQLKRKSATWKSPQKEKATGQITRQDDV
jgi:hypothetical protein